MSLNQILRLVAEARRHTEQASRETERLIVDGLTEDAHILLMQAHKLAMASTPRITHAHYGEGQIVGVTFGGSLELEVDGLGYTIAIPANQVCDLNPTPDLPKENP